MTELIAYRYKQRAADGGETIWTPWRSGRTRAEMMAELRELHATITIAQCAVPRSEPDEINGRANDLWIWTRRGGWKKSNNRNWFVDSCDPTQPNVGNINEPFEHPVSQERLDYYHRKLYGIDNITNAITTDEMANE